ncbi:unnamed protein product, partial [Symbiodinium necroappetens]
SLGRYLPGEGASAALRQGTEQEIESAIPVTVSLAVGEMVMFRNDSGTLLVREPVLPIVTIVPMSALPLLGREISWSDRGCYVRHPSQGLLPVLIAEYERFLLRHQATRNTSERMWQHAFGQAEVSLSSLKEWLGKHLRSDSCGELELQTVATVLFPDLPEALASQVAACPSFDPSFVPFNRRTRRQLFDPQVPTLVHLFAGQHRWRNSMGQVLEVDTPKGADLLSDDVFGMLLRAATLGVIDGVVIAPHCRTFDPDASAPTSNGLSFRGDEGEERSLLLAFVVSCAKEKVFTCLEMPESSTAWGWPGCENVSVCLGGWTASFDQGTLGHPCSKASAVYTSSFQLYESLHEMKHPPEAVTNLTSDFSGKGWAPGC